MLRHPFARRASVAVLVFGLLLIVHSSRAGEDGKARALPAWRAANERSAALVEKDEHARALKEARRAIRLYPGQEPFVADTYATLAFNAAAIARRLGGPKGAISLLDFAASRLTAKTPDEVAAAVKIRLGQAAVLRHMGDFRRMELVELKAVGVLRRGLGEKDPNIAKLYLKLANEVKAWKGAPAARRYLSLAWKVVEDRPEDDPVRLFVMSERAKFAIEMTHYARARERFEEILAICARSDRRLRRIREIALGKLVYLAVREGDERRADALMRRVIANARPNGDAEPLYTVLPEVPPAARNAGLILTYDVTPAGRVENVRISRASGHPQWEAEVRRAVKKWRFIPARKDGRPIRSFDRRYRMTLTIERSVPTGSRLPQSP